jgi:hypothetical protein
MFFRNFIIEYNPKRDHMWREMSFLSHFIALTTELFCCRHHFQRCAPMSLVLDLQGAPMQNFGTFPAPNKVHGSQCPMCLSGSVNGIYIEPLDFNSVERAIDLRKQGVGSEPSTGNNDVVQGNGKKHPRDEDVGVEADSSYLLLSNAPSSSLSSSVLTREQQRTGRWTTEEIAFVDFLVNAFDQGTLPLPHGIKLNEFLGDMLLCKSSRLTKKMKNAKLSTRSFVLCSPKIQSARNDCEFLSNLQETFLSSISSEPTQLELRFNLEKQWRTHFSNLCVQVGYPHLDAKDWLSSLEEMEQRAARAEDAVRRVRRRKISMALQTDGGSSANPSIFIGGVTADIAGSQLKSALCMPEFASSDDKLRTVSAGEESSSREDAHDSFLNLSGSSLLSRGRSRTMSADFFENPRQRSFSEDFDAVLDTLLEEEVQSSAQTADVVAISRDNTTSSPHSCGAFLDAIVHYMEIKKLPFQHADLWVPSFAPRDTSGPSKAVDTDQLRLYHAGHATRGDLNDSLAFKLHEFGVYSDNFSFEPGHGLPGRIYTSGNTLWECDVHDKDPSIFERAGGAKVFGIKTAVGIPINTALVGRIVIVIYSCESVPEDIALARDCAFELAKHSPEPAWKVSVDSNNSQLNANNEGLLHQVKYGNPEIQPSYSSAAPALWQSNTSPPTIEGSSANKEENDLISLLGLEMPSIDRGYEDQQGSSSVDNSLIPHFMSVRLLLLRSPERRTSQENEMLEVLMNSYRAYSNDNRRTSKDLASLIVKDWVCLTSTYAQQNTTLPQSTSNLQMTFQPVPRRPSVEPVQRRLVSEPSLQMAATSLHPLAHPGSRSSSSQSLQYPNSKSSSQSPAFRSLDQVSSVPMTPPSQAISLPSRTSESTQLMNHTQYLPRSSSLDETLQFSNGVGNRPTSGSIDLAGSMHLLPTTSSCIPQGTQQPSPLQHSHNSMNAVSPANVILEQ